MLSLQKETQTDRVMAVHSQSVLVVCGLRAQTLVAVSDTCIYTARADALLRLYHLCPVRPCALDVLLFAMHANSPVLACK